MSDLFKLAGLSAATGGVEATQFKETTEAPVVAEAPPVEIPAASDNPEPAVEIQPFEPSSAPSVPPKFVDKEEAAPIANESKTPVADNGTATEQPVADITGVVENQTANDGAGKLAEAMPKTAEQPIASQATGDNSSPLIQKDLPYEKFGQFITPDDMPQTVATNTAPVVNPAATPITPQEEPNWFAKPFVRAYDFWTSGEAPQLIAEGWNGLTGGNQSVTPPVVVAQNGDNRNEAQKLWDKYSPFGAEPAHADIKPRQNFSPTEANLVSDEASVRELPTESAKYKPTDSPTKDNPNIEIIEQEKHGKKLKWTVETIHNEGANGKGLFKQTIISTDATKLSDLEFDKYEYCIELDPTTKQPKPDAKLMYRDSTKGNKSKWHVVQNA